MSTRSTYAVGAARRFQYVAPIVFGRISDNTRIATVSPAENRAIQASPQRRNAYAPPTDALAVCAIVFSVRIAAIGSSRFARIRAMRSPARSPRSCISATCECDIDSSTASRIEHVKEMMRPITMTTMSAVNTSPPVVVATGTARLAGARTAK